MVAVAMRVGHYERDGPAHQPFCELGRVAFAGARVDQKRSLLTKNHIEERFLVVYAARFAKDVEGRIVFVNLPRRELGTVGSAGLPSAGQRTCFDILPEAHNGGEEEDRE